MSEQSTEEGTPLEIYSMVVNESPFEFWDIDGTRRQLQFLQSIDATFFQYTTDLHAAQLDGEFAVKASAAIRIAYSHALECLFSLIGSALQAPDYPVGWMLRYQNRELRVLIEKITHARPYLTRHLLAHYGWGEVVRTLLKADGKSDEVEEFYELFTRVWRSLAMEYIEETFEQEYNSLKHGFRVASGGWQMSIAVEETPGVAASPKKFVSMENAQYGTSFFRARKLKDDQSLQWYVDDQRVNWKPIVFVKRMPFVVASIENVLTYLKGRNGAEPESLLLASLTEAQRADAWDVNDQSRIPRLTFRRFTPPDDLPKTSKAEIIATYDRE